MKPVFDGYKNSKICVAVSGGRDSMALLHYMRVNAVKYGITLSALNCDHGIRGERSVQDSAFVKAWCVSNGVPLLTYVCDCIALAAEHGTGIEEAARDFRRSCYFSAAEGTDGNGKKIIAPPDFIATAHHMNDNAETVLFNLARGASLSGVTGICDADICSGGKTLRLIRPLIGCTREEIDEYVRANDVPFVEDETNVSAEYTRNYIRLNVLPELEKAVPGALKAIYRFSRLAAEADGFIRSEMHRQNIISTDGGVVFIKPCQSRALFACAAVEAVKTHFGKKDYTSEHIETLFNLQRAENGKKFEFLNLTAYKENSGISICRTTEQPKVCCAFASYVGFKSHIFGGQPLEITLGEMKTETTARKVLRFDYEKVTNGATVRFAEAGDFFTKFGGGTKNLGDYFTDKKIPPRLRKNIPLIAAGKEILAVCGVEISDKIKVTSLTEKVGYIICADYARRKGV